MKDRMDAILRTAQAEYLERLLPPRDALLAEMEELAAERDVSVSDPEVGRVLTALARGSRGRRLLEVGTAIGYGTLCMARGAPEAEIVTIDRDPEMLELARGFLERAGVLDRVRLIEGEATEALNALEAPFDLFYLDGDKLDYRRCLDLALPKLAVGATIAVDNLLWKGWVAEPPEGDEGGEPRALRAFNGYFTMHPQLVATVLPFGDGFGLAAKTKPLVTELGGPF